MCKRPRAYIKGPACRAVPGDSSAAPEPRDDASLAALLQTVFPGNSSHALENSADVEVYPTTCSKFRIMIFRSQPFSGRLSSTVSGYSLE